MKELKSTCDISFKPILTEEEACLFLGISKKAIYNLRIERKIGFCEKKGLDKARIRYRREHLIDYFNKYFNEVKPIELNYK